MSDYSKNVVLTSLMNTINILPISIITELYIPRAIMLAEQVS